MQEDKRSLDNDDKNLSTLQKIKKVKDSLLRISLLDLYLTLEETNSLTSNKLDILEKCSDGIKFFDYSVRKELLDDTSE